MESMSLSRRLYETVRNLCPVLNTNYSRVKFYSTLITVPQSACKSSFFMCGAAGFSGQRLLNDHEQMVQRDSVWLIVIFPAIITLFHNYNINNQRNYMAYRAVGC